jgi:hypothetical protein
MTVRAPARVKQTSATTGTGAYALIAPAGNARAISAHFTNGAKVAYFVADGSNYELGRGTLTTGAPDTLSRDEIFLSSNGNAAVNWAPGVRDVAVWVPGTFRSPTSFSTLQTIGAGDWGAVYVFTGSSNLTQSLPAVANLPDGYSLVFRNAGTAGAVLTLDPNGAELIEGAATLAIPPGATVEAIPVAGAWRALFGGLPFTGGSLAGALNTAKGAAVASASSCNIWGGADGNLIHVTGTTTINDFATAPQAGAERLIIFDGATTIAHDGTHIVNLQTGANVTVAAGDMALVVADTATKAIVTFFRAIAATLGTIIVQDRKSSSTDGASITVNTFTDRDLNTKLLDTASIATVSSPNITLPAGTYDLWAVLTLSPGSSANFRHRLFNTTDGAVQQDTGGLDIVSSSLETTATFFSIEGTLRARFTLGGTKSLKFQSWTNAGSSIAGQHSSGTGNSEPEVYLTAEFVKVA